MFQTEDFIQEVEKKECIWNKNHPLYNNSQARRAAWEEIAEVIYHGWNGRKYYEKDEKVLEMSKKWRNIRDYYKKERKRSEKEENDPTNSKSKKKRIYNYFSYLKFLDVQNYPSSSSQIHNTTCISDDDSESSYNDAHEHQDPQEEEHEIIEIKTEILDTKRPSVKPAPPPSKRVRRLQNMESHSTATKNFLMSLIPDVETLNEQQYMNFRLGVLSLLNNIKFGSGESENESWVISTIGNNSS